MTSSKLSKTSSFTLTSTPIFPPEPPNHKTTSSKLHPKAILIQTLCPHSSPTLSRCTKSLSHLNLQPLFCTLLIFFILFSTSALRLVHCSKLPNFTSTTKVYLFKVPVTTTTTTSIRNRQQLSTVAISTETPSVSSAALITSQSVSISTSTSTPATFTPTCNYTEYPHSGCSPIFKASCDRETNSCICGTASTSNDKTDLQLGTNKFRNSRHRKRFCLNQATLGSVCQSSGQCKAVDAHSGCHSTSGDFTSWRCSCSVGFVEHDGACHPAADPTQLVDPYSRCASVGQVYISSLDRCVDKELMPFYANRGVGRAGGGRGGGNRGRGGVGTRTTGSRSWYQKAGAGKTSTSFPLFLTISLIWGVIFSSL